MAQRSKRTSARKATKKKTAAKARSKALPKKPAKAVYFFGGGRAEGRAGMRNLLGGKGANLAEMSRLGVPVPGGFTISTEVCNAFYAGGRKLPQAVREQVIAQLGKVEKTMGGVFGDRERPLLVSVRSGARVSMPGMMDTVLNLGLNDETVLGLAEQSGDRRFAFDSYRRFIQMYGDVVLGAAATTCSKTAHDPFEEGHRRQEGGAGDRVRHRVWTRPSSSKELAGEFKTASCSAKTGKAFPRRPGTSR